MPRYKSGGFTLLETIVALAIVSVALGASVRSASMATQAAESTRQKIFATWVAKNKATEYRLRPSGRLRGEMLMGGIPFYWRVYSNNEGRMIVEVSVEPSGKRILVSLNTQIVQ